VAVLAAAVFEWPGDRTGVVVGAARQEGLTSLAKPTADVAGPRYGARTPSGVNPAVGQRTRGRRGAGHQPLRRLRDQRRGLHGPHPQRSGDVPGPTARCAQLTYPDKDFTVIVVHGPSLPHFATVIRGS
jgi:hypothetical protein